MTKIARSLARIFRRALTKVELRNLRRHAYAKTGILCGYYASFYTVGTKPGYG